jgi:gas vesicle protein
MNVILAYLFQPIGQWGKGFLIGVVGGGGVGAIVGFAFAAMICASRDAEDLAVRTRRTP